MNRPLRAAALALSLLAIASTANAGVEWTAADGPPPAPKAPIQFFAQHVKAMRANHPGGTFETSGYQYSSDPSSGQLITGIQVRLAGPISNPCWYLATWSPSGKTTSASCQGN